ncbi:MAG TPA: hypothetical protein DE060_10595 [Lentisphaeria bacterium]|nr:hypothetical protein [Lentisphaeria bacterium]HCG49633.1 hypothetical protein [Lentisphaeria bacterium]
MRKTFVGIALLLCAGCVQVLQWDTAERQTVEAEHENAITQIELTGAAGELATIAEEQAATALDYKLSTLSQAERIKLLIDQAEWQRWVDRRNAEFMGDGSIAPMLRYGREESRLKNRFLELTVPEEVRQAFIAMRNAPVRFQNQTISLNHGELDFVIPENKRNEFTLEFETIAQLNIPFCREIKNGKDTFLIGVIEPTNFGVVSSFGEGTESNLCIWKNGANIANYLVGRKITVQNISISQGMVEVFFLDQGGKLHQKKFDCQTTNDDPILINHWTTERIN